MPRKVRPVVMSEMGHKRTSNPGVQPSSQSPYSGIEAQQDAASQLVVAGADSPMLGSGMDIPKAALQATAFVDRAASTGIVQDVNGLGGSHGCLCIGQAQRSAHPQRIRSAGFYLVPGLLRCFKKKGAGRAQQGLGTTDITLNSRRVAKPKLSTKKQ